MAMQTKLFINGKFVDAVSDKTFASINPATGEPIAQVAEGDAADIDLAVKAARSAYENEWSAMDSADRGRLLYKLAQLVEQHGETLAQLDTLDGGRPISDTRADVPAAVGILEFFAGLPTKIRGATLPGHPGLFNYTRREPYGVMGAIIPWNYPLYNAVSKLAPILACGNTVVLKPAEQTPLTALELAKICREAGIPDGVVNVVPGFGPTAGAALVRHMDVDKVSFTGSTEVGRLIMEMAARSNLKGITLELGGKAPNIVLADANLDAALQGALLTVFLNQGQTCTAGTRLLVQDSIADEFVDRLAAKAEQIKVGDPMREDTKMGAIISQEQFDKVRNYIDSGRAEGAKLRTGGQPPSDPALQRGYFMRPTIFTDVEMRMRIAQEEIFGPVLSVIRFKDEAEALRLGNSVSYGLSAAVWTKDVARAHRLANGLQAGIVWVNTMYAESPGSPVGGYKQSGFGKEYGLEAMDEYMRLKTVWIDMTDSQWAWADA